MRAVKTLQTQRPLAAATPSTSIAAALLFALCATACTYLPPLPRHQPNWNPDKDACFRVLSETRSVARTSHIASSILTVIGGIITVGGGAAGFSSPSSTSTVNKPALVAGGGGLLAVVAQLFERVPTADERYQNRLRDWYKGDYATCVQ